MTPPRWAVPVIGAALSAVLSSGVTVLVLHRTAPELFAIDPGLELTPEQRHLAELLAEPAPPYAALSPGRDVTNEGLDGLGFRRGWTRAWQAPSTERVESYVLEFADPRGARTYVQGTGRAAALLIEPVPFVVTGVPDCVGLADRVKDRSGRYAQVVVMHRDARAALLVFSGLSATPGPEVLALAQRQYAALRGT